MSVKNPHEIPKEAVVEIMIPPEGLKKMQSWGKKAWLSTKVQPVLGSNRVLIINERIIEKMEAAHDQESQYPIPYLACLFSSNSQPIG